MKRQSRRATLLTLLAAFYLPLTLVTDIFGMNIKEFSDANAPPYSLCFEALGAVIAVTAVFFGLYRYLPLVFPKPRIRQTASRYEPSRLRRCFHILSACYRNVYEALMWLERRRQERQEADSRTEPVSGLTYNHELA
jgi:hypothetical protein